MDRRTFLTRGSAALAAAALAAALPKQAAAVPTAPPVPPTPSLLHRYRDAYGVEHVVETVPTAPTTTPHVDRYLDDAEWSSLAGMRILGGEVKIDRFLMDGYVPRPRALYLNPTLLAQAKAASGDSFFGVPLVSTYVGYTPQTTRLHWWGRAATGDARLQGSARRRLLRGR